MKIIKADDMELKMANEYLNVNGIFVDKSTVTGKYFWMFCKNGTFSEGYSGFDTVQEAFDDAVD